MIRRHAGAIGADLLHDLTLEATGSKAKAERAFLARRSAELSSGRPVGD